MGFRLRPAVLALIILLFFSSLAAAAGQHGNRFRNVIIMVPDGCSPAQVTVARWYKGAPLALDRMYLGGVRTYGANSLITDSAPAATAFATGHKTADKFIGILPDSVTTPGAAPIPEERRYKPVPSVLEGAKLIGKSVGLVATSNIQHATPAAFSAHWPDRNNYNEIGKHQVYQGMDVVLGGGKQYLVPKEKGGARTDGEDLTEVLRAKGYLIVHTREELEKARGNRVWGAFADDAMANEFDRPHLRPEEPALAEMTKKALTILSKNKKGFFLMVEGSKVDWAAHANDPIGVVSEVLAFDEAVKVALDFAKKDGKTLVLAFADHGTGGMSLGSDGVNKSYSTLPFEKVFGPLKKAVLTAEGVEQKLEKDGSEEKIRNIVGEFYGIKDLTAGEIKTLRNASQGPRRALGPMMSARSGIGWTTKGHTGEDVFLYHYGLNRPLGLIENTEIAGMTAKALGFDLSMVESRLFVPAREVFSAPGVIFSLEGAGTGKAVLTVRKGEARADFPLGTNLMYIKSQGKTYEMEGISVLAPHTGKIYLPGESARLLERSIKNIPVGR
ncbi:MAG TPA: alkaline phosphatase [Syntrophorhabdaceae bacterium]